jgi:hypothetical protein
VDEDMRRIICLMSGIFFCAIAWVLNVFVEGVVGPLFEVR